MATNMRSYVIGLITEHRADEQRRTGRKPDLTAAKNYVVRELLTPEERREYIATRNH